MKKGLAKRRESSKKRTGGRDGLIFFECLEYKADA